MPTARATTRPTARSDIARTVSRICAARPEVAAAYIFGSVAQGRTRPDSDIDIAVLLADRFPPGRALDMRLTLAGQLGAGLRRDDVQLVLLNEVPPLLAQRVLSQGILVFERSREARVRFQVRTASRYADLVPTMEWYIRRLKNDVRENRLRG
jgi:predicted nucleotidyltransferase